MKNDKQVLQKDDWKLFTLTCLPISIIFFIFLIMNSHARPLNVDDFAQIDFIRKGLSLSEIYNRLLVGDVQPPLISVIIGIWIRFVPADLQLLKIPSEIAVSIGVFLCGACGMKLRNITTGILTCILAATSLTVFEESSFSLRPYGFFFLSGAVVALSYIDRNEKIFLLSDTINSLNSKKGRANSNAKQIIKYGIAMVFTVYTHYFGVVLCGSLFLVDFILYLKKEIALNNIISYLIAGISFLPWAILGMQPAMGKFINNFWPEPPTLQTLGKFYVFLCNGKNIVAALFTICLLVLLVSGIHKIQKTHDVDRNIYTYISLTIAFILMIVFVFIYSAIIKPKASIFVFRYFVVLLPILYLLVASGFNVILQMLVHFLSKVNKNVTRITMIGAFAILLIAQNYVALTPQKEAYEQSAKWLRQQKDIQDDDVLMMTTYVNQDGFNYVMTENWQLNFPPANSIIQYYNGSLTLSGKKKVYIMDDFTESLDVRNAVLSKDFRMVKDYPEMNLSIYIRTS